RRQGALLRQEQRAQPGVLLRNAHRQPPARAGDGGRGRYRVVLAVSRSRPAVFAVAADPRALVPRSQSNTTSYQGPIHCACVAMRIFLNGEAKTCDSAFTVTQLLSELGLTERRVAVE